MKLGTYAQYAYALTMGFIRWSICSLLYRIFITKGFRRASAYSPSPPPPTTKYKASPSPKTLSPDIKTPPT